MDIIILMNVDNPPKAAASKTQSIDIVDVEGVNEWRLLGSS